jgi:hypothetical protein
MHGATTPAAGADTERLIRAALAWLARLPLLTEPQLSLLLGCGDGAARTALCELHRCRLASSVVVDSPEFIEPLRLHHLTVAGVEAVAQQLGVGRACLAERLPVTRDELLIRLARVETAVGLTDVIAALADDLRYPAAAGNGAEIALDDAAGTLWAPHRGRLSAFPESVEAWMRFGAGSMRATMLLAWDRAGAPRAHRRERAAAWYRADELQDAPWGPTLPPLVVVCPDERVIAHWEALLDGSAARRGRTVLQVAYTTATELLIHGPLARIWRLLGGSRRVALRDVLAWNDMASARRWPSQPLPTCQTSRERGVVVNGVGIGFQRWAVQTVRSEANDEPPALTVSEHRAALGIGLSATQKTLLTWVAHHPLLPAGHLATILRLTEPAVATLLDGLARCDLIIEDATPRLADTEGRRYALTPKGADLLAIRDGVPLHRYLREGSVAVQTDVAGSHRRSRTARGAGAVRLTDLRRRPEHTTGVQRFALALAQGAAREWAQGRDHRLLAWLSAAEAQEWFRYGGRLQHIWPDARFQYHADTVVYDLLLEWDRGLARERDHLRKFAAYSAYLTARPLPANSRLRLVVATTSAAAQRVRAAVAATSQGCPRLGQITRIITHEAVDEDRITCALWPVAAEPKSPETTHARCRS